MLLRKLHSLPGLILGIVLMVLATSGAVLSVEPVLDRIKAAPTPASLDVATLAAEVAANHPSVERLERSANGVFTASYETADGFATMQVDPATGADIGPADTSAFMRWMKAFHRSFQLDDPGRAVAGISAGTMALLAVSGLLLLAAALGGWRRLGGRVPSRGANRWHAMVGRVAVAGLAVSALTGAWMSLATFGFVSDGGADSPDFPFEVNGGTPAAVETLAGLQAVPADDLRRLTWPAAGDATDVFGLRTTSGAGYVDQASGETLNWLPHSGWRLVWEWVYMLHSGQGLWWFGLILGASALSVPLLSVTGTLVWWKRRSARVRLRGGVAMKSADVVVLVGSEGGSTWGFAATLGEALVAGGRKVALGEMNALGPMPAAKALIVLTSTYGNGDAPASASRFRDRIAQWQGPRPPVAVLGFGDRSFPDFCAYGDVVSADLAAAGWSELMPFTRIDRQSAVDFATWGEALGEALGLPLELTHKAAVPKTRPIVLQTREAYGEAVGAPSAILRFTAPEGGKLPNFEAGDLVGILAPGSDLPRYYSLASSRRDGVLEVAVRKAPFGLCSGYLNELDPGCEVSAFIRPNPEFRLKPGKAPAILIAAGCGVAPMLGFLRHNKPGRDATLYFGARDPESDFLYHDELARLEAEGKLSRLVTAFSRVDDRAHVQDRLRADAPRIARQIAAGGEVLICGSAAMAKGVSEAFAEILAPTGGSVAALKAAGRYHEDVY